jgi:cytochrome oxidase Cu insertion factor (SCO1/SenC/PrrC family)
MKQSLLLVAVACALSACGLTAAGRDGTVPPTESTRTLSAGMTAPNFSLRSVAGERFELHDATRAGPVVLVFYRGHW